MYHWYKLSPEDTQLAIGYFEEALASEPNFAQGACRPRGNLGRRPADGRDASSRRRSENRKAAAERALRLDPKSFQANFIWATYSTWTAWNWDDAERAFLRAIDLNPNFPDSHAYYSHFLNIVGRFDEARTEIEKALYLDPFNPLIHSLYAVDLAIWNEFDVALRGTRRNPESGGWEAGCRCR